MCQVTFEPGRAIGPEQPGKEGKRALEPGHPGFLDVHPCRLERIRSLQYGHAHFWRCPCQGRIDEERRTHAVQFHLS